MSPLPLPLTATLRLLLRRIGRAVRKQTLRTHIAQMQALLARHGVDEQHEAPPRQLYEARMAELICELYALEQQR
jgi:hypothetical protein